MTWANVITRSNQLEFKAAHSMVSYEHELIIFGGYNDNGFICPSLQVISLNEKKVQ